MNWFAKTLAKISGRASGNTDTLAPPESAQRALLPAALWDAVRARHAFLFALPDESALQLRKLCAEFMATRAINGAGGLVLDDTMRASIAAQACLPVLELGLSAYPLFSEIIVYPGEFRVQRSEVDESGVVHEFEDVIAGEAWDGGPVVLSWEDASGETRQHGAYNVVIHEFVHKLDMGNGAVDGIPRFFRSLHGDLNDAEWCAVLDAALDGFTERVDAFEANFPRDIDPESDAGAALYATLPLDAYAATDPGEFFSVASESFFVEPRRLALTYPDLYALFARYFRQDPAAR